MFQPGTIHLGNLFVCSCLNAGAILERLKMAFSDIRAIFACGDAGGEDECKYSREMKTPLGHLKTGDYIP